MLHELVLLHYACRAAGRIMREHLIPHPARWLARAGQRAVQIVPRWRVAAMSGQAGLERETSNGRFPACMPGVIPGGNVDWNGQHCRFCRFFTFVSTADLSWMPNSSLLAAGGDLTFGVLGGKSGKIAARNGNEVARWAAKTARFRRDSVMYTASWSWLPAGDGVVFAHGMRLFRCERGWVAAR